MSAACQSLSRGEDGLLHVLRRVDWQLFCTLTFRGVAPTVGPAKGAFFAWLRTMSRSNKRAFIDWRDIQAVVRYELGGIGGRPHLHILFAGLPHDWLCRSGRLRMAQHWSGIRIDKDFFPTGKVGFARTKEELGYGIAEVLAFDSSLDGVAYIFKPGIAYEFSRFTDRAQTLLDFRSIFFTEALTDRLAMLASDGGESLNVTNSVT